VWSVVDSAAADGMIQQTDAIVFSLYLQTAIDVEFESPDTGEQYELQWKEYPASWDSCPRKTVSVNSTKTKASAEDLEPGTTYCVRLLVNGEAGPELIVDTEQVGCTPKAEKGCCMIS
jgi:hypothetical protein